MQLHPLSREVLHCLACAQMLKSVKILMMNPQTQPALSPTLFVMDVKLYKVEQHNSRLCTFRHQSGFSADDPSWWSTYT